MAERRLLNDLMEYYQKLERPVANESDAVQLKEGKTVNYSKPDTIEILSSSQLTNT